uniref:Uncharacterized protein n=1 Tax=Ixodes ricinus TaxID=34613 RepID=A0A6B0ULD4_IXORI
MTGATHSPEQSPASLLSLNPALCAWLQAGAQSRGERQTHDWSTEHAASPTPSIYRPVHRLAFGRDRAHRAALSSLSHRGEDYDERYGERGHYSFAIDLKTFRKRYKPSVLKLGY